jgi:hypothetical protein
LPLISVIIIEGNTRTEDRVIYAELKKAGVEVGAIVSEPNLAKAAENLNKRGIFDPDEPPQVSVMLGEGTDHSKHVLVKVKETQTCIVGMGVGSYVHRATKPQPIEDAYRMLVSYQSLFVTRSDILNRPRTGVWFDPR